MSFTGVLYFWLLPAIPALYYLYVVTKAQIIGIDCVADNEIRVAVAALSLVLLCCGIYLLLSEQSEIRVGLSGWIGLNSKITGALVTIASVIFAYAAKNAERESIAPWVWVFGMSREIADLEMSRKSAISAKRRISRARREAKKND